MSITEIPPRNPVPVAQPPTAPGSDLYDASSWETAYLEMHDVPALLIQLQDDLSRSRQREAFWISVVVHLAIVILVVNSTRLEGLMHRRSVILVNPQDLMKQKELTYLELPPDEQKLTKRPDTNKISDKDRMATSKAPQLDRKELKKILDSARPGAPGQVAPPAQSQPAPPAPAAQGPQAPCYKPPWGELVAVDANTGAIKWSVPLGVMDELPEGKKNTGDCRMNSALIRADPE